MPLDIISSRLLIRAFLLVCAPSLLAQQAPDASLVRRALAVELRSATDTQHPMRYRLRKSSSRLATTKEIVETRDGAVARLVAINDQPLSPGDEQKEQSRLDSLVSDSSLQRHRKQSEENDTNRVRSVLRAMPDAFNYNYAGSASGPTGAIAKFTFQPNPGFTPTNLETDVLPAMSGEIWINPMDERVVRIEGHLQRDVNIGWGLFGRLYKGGSVLIEQSDVGNHQWRTVRLQLAMEGRVLFRDRSFDTVEEQSHFAPVPLGLGYLEAIQILRGGAAPATQPSR
jgi:hypothetical protein